MEEYRSTERGSEKVEGGWWETVGYKVLPDGTREPIRGFVPDLSDVTGPGF